MEKVGYILDYSPQKEFTPIPEGLYEGVCYAAHFMGPCLNFNKDGFVDKARLFFEVNKTIEGGEYHGKRFTVRSALMKISLHERATFRNYFDVLYPEKFDFDNPGQVDPLAPLVGRPCTIHVEHNKGDDGKVYANIKSISPLMEGRTPMVPENKPDMTEYVLKEKERYQQIFENSKKGIMPDTKLDQPQSQPQTQPEDTSFFNNTSPHAKKDNT